MYLKLIWFKIFSIASTHTAAQLRHCYELSRDSRSANNGNFTYAENIAIPTADHAAGMVYRQQQCSLNNGRTHNGLLAATDAVLVFLPFLLGTSKVEQTALLTTFDTSAAPRKATAIEKLQHKIHRDWIVKGKVPMTEAILLSRGLIAPQVNQSYITVLSEPGCFSFLLH
ncbi:hypothetical protein C8J57DRAFT_1239512 [Mycena rebaudengoi]|nr:hypothetical protein C8J57DRAFT_1239512 [Mycena rebaudengoi]